MKPPDDSQERPRLALHLSIALLVKFALLALLWFVLVVPYRVEVDASAMEQRLAPVSPQSRFKEQTDDRSDRR